MMDSFMVVHPDRDLAALWAALLTEKGYPAGVLDAGTALDALRLEAPDMLVIGEPAGSRERSMALLQAGRTANPALLCFLVPIAGPGEVARDAYGLGPPLTRQFLYGKLQHVLNRSANPGHVLFGFDPGR